MAIYHFHVTQVSRGKGQAVVAAAAYRAGEVLHDNYYGEDHDYSKKGGVILTEIFLPEHVPIEYGDREYLWNDVEAYEKNPKAQLAYSFDFALPNELGDDDNYELTKKFVVENFVSKGMICDVAIHRPSRQPGDIENPHVHVLVPMRSMDECGKWNTKQRREYILDENGKRIRDENGKYVFNAVKTNDWGEVATLEEWRKNWAIAVNEMLEKKGISERVDSRSNADRGIDELPTIHEGVAVRTMEKKGIRTDKGEWNRFVVSINRSIKNLINFVKKIKAEIAELIEEEKEQRAQNREFADAVATYIDKVNAKYYGVLRPKKVAEVIFYLQEHNIHSLEDFKKDVDLQYEKLGNVRDKLKELETKAKDIDEVFRRYEQYKDNLPVYNKWKSIRSKDKRAEFEEAHRAELKMYHMTNRILMQRYPDKKIPVNILKRERESLRKEIDELYDDYHKAKEDANKAFRLQCEILEEKRSRERRQQEHSL